MHGVPPTGTVRGDLRRRIDEPLSRPAPGPCSSASPGHRDGNATACPGNGLYAQLPRLRTMVDPGPPRAPTTHLGRARAAQHHLRRRRPALRVQARDGARAAARGARSRCRCWGASAGARTTRCAPTPTGSRDHAAAPVVQPPRCARASRASPACSAPARPALTVGVRPVVTRLRSAGRPSARGRVPVTGTVQAAEEERRS